MASESKARLLYVLKLLEQYSDEEHPLTTADLLSLLLEKYGISTHRITLKTDIETLQAYGVDIEVINSSQNKYYISSRQFEIPELKLLIDAVESSKFITAAKSKELVKKLCALTSESKRATLVRNVSCEGRIKPGNEKIYYIVDCINEAINQNKKISFYYFRYNVRKEKKLRHEGKPYVITPLHLVWNGDYYYMVGVYDYQQRIGSFRVDRIAKCPEILSEEGTPAPEDFDIDEFINTTFRMFNSDHIEVELICDNSVMDSIIDRFGEDVVTYANDMTSFRAVVKVAVNHVFYSWIFGFGGKVKIKTPIEVKDEYIAMLNAAIGEE